MKRVAFISADWSNNVMGVDGRPIPGGAGWYRVHLPAHALADHGWEVGIYPNLVAHKMTGEIGGQDFDGRTVWGFEVIVLQRWMYREAPEVIRRARKLGQVVINDVDDWFGGLDPSNRAFVTTHPKYNPESNRDHYARAIAASSAVTCSTAFLADRYRQNNEVHVLRNAIDLDRWTPQRPSEGRKPVVGWVGAVPWRSGDLETLRGLLGPFLDRHDLRFLHGGHIPGDQHPTAASQLGISEDRVVNREWCPIYEYPGLFADMEVGTVPLRDVPFNQAKCLSADHHVWVLVGHGFDIKQVRRKALGDVTPGDVIWSGGGWVPVQAVDHQPSTDGFLIETEAGHSLLATPDHRLFTEFNPAEGGDAWQTPEQIAARDGACVGIANVPEVGPADGYPVLGVAPVAAGVHPHLPTGDHRFSAVTKVTPHLIDVPVDLQVQGNVFLVGSAEDTGVVSHNSAIKGMEYAASGIPFVAQDMPEYRWLGLGYLARRAKDWNRGLTRLLDPSARAEASEAGLVRVAEEDISLRWKEWADAYESIRP